MNTLNDGGLTLHCHDPAPGVIRVQWLGRSDARFPGEALNPYLSQVLAQAHAAAAAVEMHFEDLEYLNSSTISVVMHFLATAREARVPLSFTYQPKVRWQKLSFEALRVFEHLDKQIRVVALQ